MFWSAAGCVLVLRNSAPRVRCLCRFFDVALVLPSVMCMVQWSGQSGLLVGCLAVRPRLVFVLARCMFTGRFVIAHDAQGVLLSPDPTQNTDGKVTSFRKELISVFYRFAIGFLPVFIAGRSIEETNTPTAEPLRG